ncbi:suppressor of loss of ypt1 [Mortierella polycephala]|uniref:Suppressor of loss of ypt1 n=1 Tax=Mortierella polycephala TaxID=41804 RepID=A0A9P6U3Q5_9FUNG|nr:suppressor of loss of ypt1 [Mortierella polycephala]
MAMATTTSTITTNALVEILSDQDQGSNSSNDSTMSHGDPASLSAARMQQLPTPRTSISSGTASPPGSHTSNNAHSHTLNHVRQQHQSTHNSNHLAQTTSFHTGVTKSSSSSSTTPDFQSIIASPNNNDNDSGGATYTRSPLGYQSQTFASFRSSSPVLSSKLGPALNAPSTAILPVVGSSSLGSSIHSVNGNGGGAATAVGVGATGTATATNPVPGTLGGRSLFQTHLQQHSSEYESQHQQQLQQELYMEDERETQKKNARSALGNVSAYLPPALNQSLTKVIQSTKDVVNGSTSHNRMSSILSSNRLPTIEETGGHHRGGGGAGVSAYAPRSSSSLLHFWLLSPSAIIRTLKFPLICLCWYMSSAVTNNIGKQIMNQFRYPVTLTFVQFWFVSVFCFLGSTVFKMTRIRSPTMAIINMTAPLVGFQVVGHVFSSVAISRVPLSVVHTVKALTPLFTVLFYRVALGTTYSRPVYLSLVPLTAGVMLACRMSLEFNNMVGLCCALLSTLVFVMQNVFTKKILSSNNSTAKQQQQQEQRGMGGLGNKETISSSGSDPVDVALGSGPKLDKINILFYSSTMAAVCMIPMWFYAEGYTLMFSEDPLDNRSATATSSSTAESTGTWTVISWLLFLNGVSHFFQNFLAFSVLALTSPVTYSIASLIKRIVVIVASIVYFHQTLGVTQWTGVCLTFWGLWMYNSAKNAAKINPASGILASTKVGRRMSRGFGRGLLDAEVDQKSQKGGFLV